MDMLNTLKSGLRSGHGQTGFQVYCRYSLPHLVCLAVDCPDDPLMSPSLSYLTVGDGYFAEQFFLNLHSQLNSVEVIAQIYQYATQCNAALSDKTTIQLNNELALMVAKRKLLVIPLYDQ